MSEEHSNFDKDPNKRPKKKSDAAQPNYQQHPQKKPPKTKDYQVLFEPKSSEKPSKDQQSSNKSNPQPSSKEEHINKGPKQENQPPHKPKQHKPYNKDSSEQPSGSSKKRHRKISKSTLLEYYPKAQPLEELGNLLNISSQLFIKEKQAPVNEERFDLDPNEGLVARFGHISTANTSTTSSTQSITQPPLTQTSQPTITGNNTNPPVSHISSSTSNANVTEKPMEMFDFSKERNDPIQGINKDYLIS